MTTQVHYHCRVSSIVISLLVRLVLTFIAQAEYVFNTEVRHVSYSFRAQKLTTIPHRHIHSRYSTLRCAQDSHEPLLHISISHFLHASLIVPHLISYHWLYICFSPGAHLAETEWAKHDVIKSSAMVGELHRLGIDLLFGRQAVRREQVSIQIQLVYCCCSQSRTSNYYWYNYTRTIPRDK